MFKENDRIRKGWRALLKPFRNVRSQHEQQHNSSAGKLKRMKSNKPLLFMGCAIVALTVVGFTGSHYVKANTIDFYEVYRDGQLMGTVHSKQQVEQMISNKQEELKSANPNIQMVLETGEITYEPRSEYKATPDTDGTLLALANQFTSHANGVELKVNGKVVGIVKDQKTADNILAKVQARFSPQPAVAKSAKEVTALAYSGQTAPTKQSKPQSTVKSVKFVEKVNTEAAEVQPTDIEDPNELYLMLVKGTTKQTKYTVQPGDCIGCIAQKFDISPEVIYERNKWIKNDEITIGDVLDLTVLKPQVTVETIENITEMETIEPIVEVQKNANMRAGQSKVIREGQSGKKRVVYKLVRQNGYLMSEELISEEVLVPSVSSIVMKGTKVILGEGSGKFAWPVSGARLTSSFGQRWGRQHKGIDLIGNKNIKAADNGVIEFAGTKNGLGRCIIINHKNGYKTTYGHLSKISVKKGQTVQKGDSIGIMGNTGHSFGTHLHFEVHKNGSLQNPMKYL